MKTAIIGAGNMGGAIALGLLQSKYIAAENLTIIDPFNTSFESMGVKVFENISKAPITEVDMVLIAVKPWIAASVMEELSAAIKDRQITVLSVVAGVTLSEMRSKLTLQPLIRVMPNTAVRNGEGMIFLSTEGVDEKGVKQAVEMFETTGSVMVIGEDLMTAATSLASCGIAFALRYIRAAIAGGIELGLGAADSQKIVAQTLLGAVSLIQDGAHPEAEIDKVTTPGGVTIKGLNAMEEAGFTNAVIQGLKAAAGK